MKLIMLKYNRVSIFFNVESRKTIKPKYNGRAVDIEQVIKDIGSSRNQYGNYVNPQSILPVDLLYVLNELGVNTKEYDVYDPPIPEGAKY